jgi:hypothetical protein
VQPGRFNFSLIQGDTFNTSPAWKINNSYVNVTGYSAKMQVRQAVTSTSVILEMSTANGRIVAGTTDGKFTITLSAVDSAALPPGNYIYDLDITSPGGIKTTLLTGGFAVVAQVTV